MQNYCLFCDVVREAFQQVSPVLTSGMKAVPSQDREEEWVTLVILTCPQLSFPVPCWVSSSITPSSPLPSFLSHLFRFLPSCSRLSHHVGPGEDDSVCFHCLPQLNLGFSFVFFMNQVREGLVGERNTSSRFMSRSAGGCRAQVPGDGKTPLHPQCPAFKKTEKLTVKLHLASQKAERGWQQLWSEICRLILRKGGRAIYGEGGRVHWRWNVWGNCWILNVSPWNTTSGFLATFLALIPYASPCLPSLYLSLEQRTLWAILTVKSLSTQPHCFCLLKSDGSCYSIRVAKCLWLRLTQPSYFNPGRDKWEAV